MYLIGPSAQDSSEEVEQFLSFRLSFAFSPSKMFAISLNKGHQNYEHWEDVSFSLYSSDQSEIFHHKLQVTQRHASTLMKGPVATSNCPHALTTKYAMI